MDPSSHNIETHPEERSGCFRSFLLIGGTFVVLIIVLVALRYLFGLN